MKLIDKATVVAEIEKRKKELIELSNDFANQWACGSLDNILSFINTLEVKEVDLEKEIKNFIEDLFREAFNEDKSKDKYWNAVATVMRYTAEHFFELGLKVNNDVVIEKACDWLKNNVTYTHPRTGETKCVVNLNAFRDAMKGE